MSKEELDRLEESIISQWTPERREACRCMKQGSGPWCEVHGKGILTAGSFGVVMGHNRFGQTYEDLLRYMLWGIPMVKRENPAIVHGLKNEPRVRKLYIEEQACHLPGFKVKETGLEISPKDPRFGASFDGLVEENGVKGLLEIKCRYRGKEAVLHDSERDQIQGTMGLFGLPWTDFVVYLGKEMVITRYAFDEDYFEKSLYPTLKKFYKEEYLPRRLKKEKNQLKFGEI